MATDGSPGTRWSSAAADPQWLRVDLGSTRQVSG
ncbi:discoidin domain-containing protein [Kitasatospora fiedleri]